MGTILWNGRVYPKVNKRGCKDVGCQTKYVYTELDKLTVESLKDILREKGRVLGRTKHENILLVMTLQEEMLRGSVFQHS